MLAAIGRVIRWCIVLLISACILTFAANNFESVNVSLFPLSYEVNIRLFLLVLVSFAFGVISGGLLVSLKMLRLRTQLRSGAKHVQALENELSALKMERPVSASTLPVAV